MATTFFCKIAKEYLSISKTDHFEAALLFQTCLMMIVSETPERLFTRQTVWGAFKRHLLISPPPPTYLFFFFVGQKSLVPLWKNDKRRKQSNLRVKQHTQVNINTETDFTINRRSATTELLAYNFWCLHTKPMLTSKSAILNANFWNNLASPLFSRTWAKELNT